MALLVQLSLVQVGLEVMEGGRGDWQWSSSSKQRPGLGFHVTHVRQSLEQGDCGDDCRVPHHTTSTSQQHHLRLAR